MIAARRPTPVSFWWEGVERPSRAALASALSVDVCIIGAGFTGLWTAYYLALADPTLRIAIVEARHVGYGASGRNGGWLTNSVTGGVEQYVATHGIEAAQRQQTALTQAVDEVIAVAAGEGIDTGIAKGGELIVARNDAQVARLRKEYEAAARWRDTDWEWLDAHDAARRISIEGAQAAMWQPHCAVLQPAQLVVGLARAVEARGVVIYENSPATNIAPGSVETARGRVRALHVIRATEGFTATLPGQRRTWLPLNSSLMITDPLPAKVLDAINWSGREALSDAAHVYIYAQRTADSRIALGGRGIPYRFGSRIDTDGATPQFTVEALRNKLHELFPETRGIGIARAWSGVLGVPRDWSAAINYDPNTRLGYAGGYVGTGVTATHLAGRTLADLILGRSTDRTTLPWVGHRARRWEPEPARWLGVSATYAAFRRADRNEDQGGSRTSRWARIATAVSGH
ncbi:MAG TPA: FAD-binding oxidoreductase [Marmoricola sp.]|nr:FAD-binding oxidoreductase [Marmoricola sp.]